jgi:hypothetical protein
MGATPIMVRLLPDQLKALDDWCKRQPDRPGRPEGLRRMAGLASAPKPENL